jgi:hypothetical protein
MTIASNLYAEKVFAEHPIGLWTLDEKADYVDLLGSEYRQLFTEAWDYTGGSVAEFLDASPEKIFTDSPITEFFIEEDGDSMQIENGPGFLTTSLNRELGTFSISTYVYPYSKSMTLELGYKVLVDGVWSEPVVSKFSISNLESWSFASDTFQIPGDDFTDFKILINVTSSSPSDGSYSFLLHGLTYGQQSEQFHVNSLGSSLSLISDMQDNDLREPIGLGLGEQLAIKANAYGLQQKGGYYLAKGVSALAARNSAMPLVFGANNSTRLIPNGDLPSLIVPGLNFMNSDGQYSDLTFEAWVKIQASTSEPKRILGPIASDDGIYVDDSFMVFKIGKYSGAYYVGEWDRPMLLAIRLSSDSASVVVNGEEVISFSMIPSEVSYPEKYEVVEGTKYDIDWIGFYAHVDVPQIFVDCVGVYPYIVPNIVEKRRWIYGQGVETPENIVGAAIGSSVAIDYTVANYSKNYSYPDIGKFQQGINENVLIENNALSMPNYDLPSLVFSDKTEEDWLAVVPDVDDLYGDAISLRPNTDWLHTDGYLLFPKLNVLTQEVKAFYALFESNPDDSSKQTLMYLENEVTKDALEVTLEGPVLSYTFKTLNLSGGMDEELLYSDSYHTPGDFLLAGINIPVFVSAFSGKIATFFGTKQEIKLYIGGRKTLDQTFSGKIYRVGFCTARNLQKISFSFSATNGIAAGYNSLDSLDDFVRDAQGFLEDDSVTDYLNIPEADGGDEYFGNANTSFEELYDGGGVFSILVSKIMEHTASYTLTPKTYLGTFALDIASNGYWQDYVPLSYFAKYVKDGNGGTYLDVDFIQFNVSYPEIKKYLNNKHDTERSTIRTYVSFQYLRNNSSISLSSFLTTELSPKDGVVIPGSNWDSVQRTRYEVVDGTIIYPPDDIDFNLLAMVLHVEIISNGIKQKPVKLRSIELSSQALNAFVPNAIGTKYGALVYPYRKSAEYYDYKGRNPFGIYKGNTPYLHLTSNSGLRLRGAMTPGIQRGISMPINKTIASYYKVGAWQMVMRFDDEQFPADVTEIFEIEANGGETTKFVKFYIVADSASRTRGRVYAVDATTGLIDTTTAFYVNGNRVNEAMVDLNSWTTLGISFNTPVDFSSSVGAFRVTGPILFNSVSHYQITAADEAARTVYRKWAGVKSVEGVPEVWDYWLNGDEVDPGSTWRQVLFVASGERNQLVDGTTIYNKYTGNDRFVVDYIADKYVRLRIKNYEYMFYNDVTWRSNITTPV